MVIKTHRATVVQKQKDEDSVSVEDRVRCESQHTDLIGSSQLLKHRQCLLELKNNNSRCLCLIQLLFKAFFYFWWMFWGVLITHCSSGTPSSSIWCFSCLCLYSFTVFLFVLTSVSGWIYYWSLQLCVQPWLCPRPWLCLWLLCAHDTMSKRRRQPRRNWVQIPVKQWEEGASSSRTNKKNNKPPFEKIKSSQQ